MKKVLFKIGVLSFVMVGILFGVQTNVARAAITSAQAQSLLADRATGWENLETDWRNAMTVAYREYVNMGDSRAFENAVADTSALADLISNGHNNDQLDMQIASNGTWSYNNGGQLIFRPRADFEADIPSNQRNEEYIRSQIDNLGNNNPNVNPDWDAVLGSSNNGDDLMVPSHINTVGASSNSPVGTTTCAEEGLEGVDFLVFHGPLVPCGVNKQCTNGAGQRVESDISKPCTICHFIILIKNVFDLLLSLIITASLFMLTVAGVMYIVSSGGQLTGMAKGIIEKTLLGFGVFLLSWLLVYTLLNMLSVRDTVVGKGSKATWFQFECDTESSFYTPPSDPAHTNPNDPAHTNPNDPAHTNPNDPAHTNIDPTRSTPANQTPVSPAITDPNIGEPIISTQSEDVARANLWEDSNGHITFWESSPGATNVREIRPTTRQGLLDFQRESGLDVIVTGGAEADPHASGAYSHANGYKIDIEDTPTVNNYIENNYTFIGNRASSTGARDRVYADNQGNYYVREGSHWDVYYGTPSPPLSTI